mgnify:CR=1 FL=1
MVGDAWSGTPMVASKGGVTRGDAPRQGANAGEEVPPQPQRHCQRAGTGHESKLIPHPLERFGHHRKAAIPTLGHSPKWGCRASLFPNLKLAILNSANPDGPSPCICSGSRFQVSGFIPHPRFCFLLSVFCFHPNPSAQFPKFPLRFDKGEW